MISVSDQPSILVIKSDPTDIEAFIPVSQCSIMVLLRFLLVQSVQGFGG